MKVLFIHPNDYLSIGIPSGTAVLSSVLKKNGHKVDIFDFTFVKTRKLEKKETAGISTFLPTEYTLEDLVADDPVVSLEDAFKQKLTDFDPDLVAASVMTGHFERLIDLLEQVQAECNVILGGVHPTIAPFRTLRHDVVDFVCVGEGEELLTELLGALGKGEDYTNITNLGYKQNGKATVNDLRPFVDMDLLPTPDWSLFDERHLFRPFMGNIYKGSFYVMSRGCPMRCSYCVNGALRETLKTCGRYFRYQSPATTIHQLKEMKEKYGATWFKFADDSIMLFEERYLRELADGLIPLNIQFGCSIRPETVTEEKIKLLKDMGMVAASVGIESGNEHIRRDVLWRPMSNDLIKKSIILLQKHGIRVSTFNMIGLPGETRENVFETIALNKSLGVETTNVYVVYPYPGTPINIKCKCNIHDEKGKIIPVSSASSFALSQMPPSEIEGLLKTFEFYVRLPEEFWSRIMIAEKSDKTAEEMRATLQKSIINMQNKSKNAEYATRRHDGDASEHQKTRFSVC